MVYLWYIVLGKFAFIDVRESGMSHGDTAYLVISDLEGNAGHCLTFYRHMFGSHIGSLKINSMCCNIALALIGCKWILYFYFKPSDTNRYKQKTI